MRFSNAFALELALPGRGRVSLRIGLILLGGLVALSMPAASSASTSTAPSPAASRAEAPASFEALLALYAARAGFEAGFEEEKTLALFREPLRSRGRLYFDPPSTLLRRVEEPRPSEILVTQDAIRIREDGREQVMDLRLRADARPLVESMLWLFAGDRAALERVYSIAYEVVSDSERSWELRLRPRSAPLDQLIRELRVRGQGQRTQTLEVIETSGDRTRTRILDPNPSRQFDAEERTRLFGPGLDARGPDERDSDAP